jgi:putative endonuclease
MGEAYAAAYLSQSGYQVQATNWRSRDAEIDLVARDGEWLVFVEVRTRRSSTFGDPGASLTLRKQANLIRAAEQYLFALPWDGLWRIDLIALVLGADSELRTMDHYRDILGSTQ